MMKHVYLIKLKDIEVVDEVVEKLRTMKENIPSIKVLEVEKDIRRAPNSYDIIEYIVFENREKFFEFCNDDYHKDIRKYLAQVAESAIKIDYEY